MHLKPRKNAEKTPIGPVLLKIERGEGKNIKETQRKPAKRATNDVERI